MAFQNINCSRMTETCTHKDVPILAQQNWCGFLTLPENAHTTWLHLVSNQKHSWWTHSREDSKPGTTQRNTHASHSSVCTPFEMVLFFTLVALEAGFFVEAFEFAPACDFLTAAVLVFLVPADVFFLAFVAVTFFGFCWDFLRMRSSRPISFIRSSHSFISCWYFSLSSLASSR